MFEKQNDELGIPRKIGQIWIGPNPAPIEWMSTWKNKHPNWEYTLYDNKFLAEFPFRTSCQIREYMLRGDYPGVADCMRLEILYTQGGVIAAADSICLLPIDNLFPEPKSYWVYENEFLRGSLVSPPIACEPGNPFINTIIERVIAIRPRDLEEAWKSVGNLFLARMIREHKPDIKIFPSHYFNPDHYEGESYLGGGAVYAKQFFASTQGTYKKNRTFKSYLLYKKQKFYKKRRYKNNIKKRNL